MGSWQVERWLGKRRAGCLSREVGGFVGDERVKIKVLQSREVDG